MHDDTDDRPHDAEMNKLFRQLGMHCRREVVRTLLAGNDTQCFTTQQYLDAYIHVINKGQRCLMDLELAKHHLQSLDGKVREVKPGVWVGQEK